MPITMELREDNRVLYYDFSSHWELSELIALYKEDLEIRNRYEHRIHVIANLSITRQLPKDILSVRTYSPDIKHSRAGFVILVVSSRFVRSTLELIVRLLNTKKVLFAATEPEAWDTMREILRKESAK